MMKRFLAFLFALLMLTSCGTNHVPTKDSDSNSEQVSVETSGSEVPDVPAENVEEKNTLEFSDTFQSLLNTLNAAHEAIPTYSGDYESYIVEHEEPDFYFSKYNYAPEERQVPNDVVLTLEQLTEDMEVFFKGLRTHYGRYEYFGGDKAFRAAVDAVIAECAALDVITCGDLRNSLEMHFAFVKDAHFIMGSRLTNKLQIPFFFRDIAFEKTETGYQTAEGKVVESVDGYDDLDNLFRLSLTIDGELVYYPIILQEAVYKDVMTTAISCNTLLTVRYVDGSIDILTAPDYHLDADTAGKAPVSTSERSGIPLVRITTFDYDVGGNQFLNTSVNYKDDCILIVDFRQCSGGKIDIVKEWFQNYVGETISPNSLTYVVRGGDRFQTLLGTEETFVSSDSILIVLTSKLSASASETFIDYAYNLENSLIIGENSFGANIASIGDFVLPNSGLYMRFGEALTFHPDGDGFEEFRGYLPDIWVPAAEVEEAVINFIAKNTTTN